MGVPMSVNDPDYEVLMKKQDAIQAKIAKDYEMHKALRDEDPKLPSYD